MNDEERKGIVALIFAVQDYMVTMKPTRTTLGRLEIDRIENEQRRIQAKETLERAMSKARSLVAGQHRGDL